MPYLKAMLDFNTFFNCIYIAIVCGLRDNYHNLFLNQSVSCIRSFKKKKITKKEKFSVHLHFFFHPFFATFGQFWEKRKRIKVLLKKIGFGNQAKTKASLCKIIRVLVSNISCREISSTARSRGQEILSSLWCKEGSRILNFHYWEPAMYVLVLQH